MEVVTSSEVNSLLPEQKYNRRNFMVTSLAAGFALAVQPVSAQTITTDTSGIIAGEVKVPVKGGEIPAYRAMPAVGTNFPSGKVFMSSAISFFAPSLPLMSTGCM